MSKWFKQYCELNRLDRDMILDKIEPLMDEHYIYALIYTNVVYEVDLSVNMIDLVIGRFNSSRDKRPVKRLIEKLERLRSQS